MLALVLFNYWKNNSGEIRAMLKVMLLHLVVILEKKKNVAGAMAYAKRFYFDS